VSDTGGIRLRFLSRALAVRGVGIAEFSQRAGLDRNTVSAAVRGGPITPRTFKRVVAALDLIPVTAVAHELGVEVAGEASARTADVGSG